MIKKLGKKFYLLMPCTKSLLLSQVSDHNISLLEAVSVLGSFIYFD